MDDEHYGAGSVNRDEYKMRVMYQLKELPDQLQEQLNQLNNGKQ